MPESSISNFDKNQCCPSNNETDVAIIGGGMYVQEVLLPYIYQLKRKNQVNNISICTQRRSSIEKILRNDELNYAFPDQSFDSYPSLPEEEKVDPLRYKEVINSMEKDNTVAISLPDHLHYEAVMTALNAGQNILCVKPLTLSYNQSKEIKELADSKGLFVGVEYHKRHDNRALIAKKAYEKGVLGEFVMGEAKMIEPRRYRESNFQNWFTKENADPFTYVGCHYIDLVSFITKLKIKEVSVKGWSGTFPNGNEGYMWTNGRIVYENGGILSIINGLGYPDNGAGSNEQSLMMFFEGKKENTLIKHDDQFRGCSHLYSSTDSNSRFRYINPDFFQLVPWDGEGYKPSGYGYESVASIMSAINKVRRATCIETRKQIISAIGKAGIIATPENTLFTDLALEAGRFSLCNEGIPVEIEYTDPPYFYVKK